MDNEKLGNINFSVHMYFLFLVVDWDWLYNRKSSHTVCVCIHASTVIRHY